MAKKSGDFYPMDMQQAMKLAQTDAAKQLMARLQSADNGQLQSAMEQASAGNMTQAKALLGQLMADPQTRDLLRQLQGDANG